MDVKDECVLLIESDPDAATFVRAALADARDDRFVIDWVANLHAGLVPISIAVNVSAIEFRREDFLANIRDILRKPALTHVISRLN